jgi:hypothetical protein
MGKRFRAKRQRGRIQAGVAVKARCLPALDGLRPLAKPFGFLGRVENAVTMVAGVAAAQYLHFEVQSFRSLAGF